MITLTKYKTYDGIDLTKCKLYKFINIKTS